MKRLIFFISLIIFLSPQAGIGSDKDKTYTVRHPEIAINLDELTYINANHISGAAEFRRKNGKTVVFFGTFVVIEE